MMWVVGAMPQCRRGSTAQWRSTSVPWPHKAEASCDASDPCCSGASPCTGGDFARAGCPMLHEELREGAHHGWRDAAGLGHLLQGAAPRRRRPHLPEARIAKLPQRVRLGGRQGALAAAVARVEPHAQDPVLECSIAATGGPEARQHRDGVQPPLRERPLQLRADAAGHRQLADAGEARPAGAVQLPQLQPLAIRRLARASAALRAAAQPREQSLEVMGQEGMAEVGRREIDVLGKKQCNGQGGILQSQARCLVCLYEVPAHPSRPVSLPALQVLIINGNPSKHLWMRVEPFADLSLPL
mmetsp:Transcript_75818/g.239859  ORF Transcript_75818/g.239859 Transcript_75818/m.239859 type:complete len:299 (+) Transcript_75818:76-972(+)